MRTTDSNLIQNKLLLLFTMLLVGFPTFAQDRVQILPVQKGSSADQNITLAAKGIESGISLDMSFSTLSSAGSLTIERAGHDGLFLSIATIALSPDQASWIYADENPEAGMNLYRVAVQNHDGNKYYSSVVSVWYASPQDNIVYNKEH